MIGTSFAVLAAALLSVVRARWVAYNFGTSVASGNNNLIVGSTYDQAGFFEGSAKDGYERYGAGLYVFASPYPL